MGSPPSGHTLYNSPSDLPPLPGASLAASTSIGTALSRRGVPASPSSAPGALRRRSRSLSLRARLLFLSSEPSSSSSACLLRQLNKSLCSRHHRLRLALRVLGALLLLDSA